MADRPYRVLVVLSHPVQYAIPFIRGMADHPNLAIKVAYCSLQGVEPTFDQEFGVEVAWDVPLLEGYDWVHIPNQARHPGLGRFLGLVNPGLWELIRSGQFDAVVAYTGYAYASFWIATLAARSVGAALVMSMDGHVLGSLHHNPWKTRIKRLIWPSLYSIPDAVVVASTGGAELLHSLGIPPKRVILTPSAVDNDWWLQQAAAVDVAAIRSAWGIPLEATIALFCAKLQPWKRPQDLIQAFAQAQVANSYLVIAGEGPLRQAMEQQCQNLGLGDRVRFLGFVNQSQLPGVYQASDLLVLPSEYETFGLVVNEAMLCQCAAVVSDQVGCRQDLIRPGETGLVYPVGDIAALTQIFRQLLGDPDQLRQMGIAARHRMDSWSLKVNVEQQVRAIETAIRFKTGA